MMSGETTRSSKKLGPRYQFVPGAEVGAGWLIALVASDGSRHRCAAFRCRHCGKTGVAELTKLLSGRVNSCGCKKIASFRSWIEQRAGRVVIPVRARWFESVSRYGVAGAAQQLGQSQYILSTARRLHCAWLRRQPTAKAIVAAANRTGHFEAVARQFRLHNSYEVNYLRRVLAKVEQVAKERAAAVWDFGHHMLHALRVDITNALDVLEARGMGRQPLGKRPGEFTRFELSRSRRSDFGWAWGYLSHGGFVPPDLQTAADAFLRACQRSFSARAARRLQWMRERNIGAAA